MQFWEITFQHGSMQSGTNNTSPLLAEYSIVSRNKISSSGALDFYRQHMSWLWECHSWMGPYCSSTPIASLNTLYVRIAVFGFKETHHTRVTKWVASDNDLCHMFAAMYYMLNLESVRVFLEVHTLFVKPQINVGCASNPSSHENLKKLQCVINLDMICYEAYDRC